MPSAGPVVPSIGHGTSETRSLFTIFTREKARGGLVSIISGTVSNVTNGVVILGFGVNPLVSTFVVMQVLGNFLTYFLDIMIAKSTFGGVHVPYDARGKRFRWFLWSLQAAPIHKFVVAAIIESLVVYLGLKRATQLCDEKNIRFKLRDTLLAALISTLTFSLFMNILRFNWVLDENDYMVLNVVMLAWMGVVVMVALSSSFAFDTTDGQALATLFDSKS